MRAFQGLLWLFTEGFVQPAVPAEREFLLLCQMCTLEVSSRQGVSLRFTLKVQAGAAVLLHDLIGAPGSASHPCPPPRPHDRGAALIWRLTRACRLTHPPVGTACLRSNCQVSWHSNPKEAQKCNLYSEWPGDTPCSKNWGSITTKKGENR